MREIGKALALVTQIGVSMIVPIFLCLILGSFLDKIFHTGNILMIVFIVLGVCAGFRSVYIMTKDFYKKFRNMCEFYQVPIYFYKDKDTYIPIKGIENKNNNNDNDDESGDF